MTDYNVLAGVLAAAYFIFFMLYIVLAVFLLIANWKTFEKAGEPGWKIFIPFYNAYIWFKISNFTAGFWIYLAMSVLIAPLCLILNFISTKTSSAVPIVTVIIAILFAAALFVIITMMYCKLSFAFGQGVGFAVGLIFLAPIFLLILGFSRNIRYIGTQQSEQTVLSNQSVKSIVTGILALAVSIIGSVTVFLHIGTGMLISTAAIVLAVIVLKKSKNKTIQQTLLSEAAIVIAGLTLILTIIIYGYGYIGDITESKKAEKAIDNIGQVTLNSKGTINKALLKYNSLRKSAREKVDNYEKLVSAKNTYNELRYNKMVSEYQNGNFENSYGDLDNYKDSIKYCYYKQAHEFWDFNNDVGVYGRTTEYLQKASGVLDADEKLKLISDLSSKYNGTWHGKGKYDIDYYIYVKDGKVGKEWIKTPDSLRYYYDLIRVDFNDEWVERFSNDINNLLVDTTAKTNIIGRCYSDGEIIEEYLCIDAENDKMFVFDISDEPYGDVQNGIYEKISEDTPPKK